MFKPELKKLNACSEAVKWAGDKSLEKIWEECERGDWMLWLIHKSELCDLKLKTLIKVECAELVAHFLTDERSKNALIVARNFAEGNATIEELNTAADAAYAAYAAAAYAYAAADARENTLKKCADIVRKNLPFSDIKKFK